MLLRLAELTPYSPQMLIEPALSALARALLELAPSEQEDKLLREREEVLCGLTFGLNVKRHRLFECSFPVMTYPCAGHDGDWLLVFGHTVLERSKQIGRTAKDGPIFRRKHVGTDRGREAMGIPWMTRDELSQAIPPAYTEHIGGFLMREVKRRAEVAA